MSPAWFVRPIDEPKIVENKLVRLLARDTFIQCGHLAQHDAASTRNAAYRRQRCEQYWKERTADFVAENCARQALYEVGKLPVCSRHAGLLLLDACLELGI